MELQPLSVGIVVASGAASVGAVLLLRYLYQHRERPGAAWFIGNIVSVALFCLTYATGLLVFDPTLRLALEAVAFGCVCFAGPFFLAFGLDYTGRGDLIRTPLFGLVILVPLLMVGLAATNPVHQLVWTDFQLDPVLGLATATYTIQPVGIVAFAFTIGTAGVGSLLLVGAILSYGPMYRREATAVVLSTVPPSIGVTLWMLGAGPVPEVHLTAPLMIVHVALDAYAFVGTHMFETNPATQRMAERSGLDSLVDPVLVLDTEQQIVRRNDQAQALLSTAGTTSDPEPLEAVLGVTLESLRETGEITIGADGGGVFGVSYTELTAPGGDAVGSMLVLYNITEERQREQQLAVLNRVLRHNLRNETTVIGGYAELLEEAVVDPEHAAKAESITAASDRLNNIAEKVRSFEQVQSRDIQPESVSLQETLSAVLEPHTESYSEATITSTVDPPSLRVRTDPVLLEMLLENLVENALVHSVNEPAVHVAASDSPETTADVRFEVRDTNEPIPEQELDTIRAGTESPLQHGQGIGLWLSYWCTRRLRGNITFEYDDGNVVAVTL